MPLNAENISISRKTRRFDHVITGRSRLDDQVVSQLFNRLMVDAVDFSASLSRIEPCEMGRRFNQNRMEVLIVNLSIAMAGGPGYLRLNVLVERPSEGDIDQLQATTYPQNRFFGGHERAEQIDFVTVSNVIAGPFGTKRTLAVTLGRDVRSPLKDEAVKIGHELAHLDSRDRGDERGDQIDKRLFRHDPMSERLFEVEQGLSLEDRTVRVTVKKTGGDADFE